MLIVFKNKGILILLYLIVSFIGTAVLAGVLHRNTKGVFSNIDFYTSVGISFLLTAIWTYLTKDDYYTNREGKKVKMDTPNELFWISMKIWSFIFLAASLLFLGNLKFNYFEPL